MPPLTPKGRGRRTEEGHVKQEAGGRRGVEAGSSGGSGGVQGGKVS